MRCGGVYERGTLPEFIENGKKRPSDKILYTYSRHLGLPKGFIETWIATQQKHGYTYQKLLLEVLSSLRKLH